MIPDKDTLFVSYSHHDIQARERLVPALRSSVGEALWIDEHKLDYGDRFDDEIRAALERSLAGVLLISQHFFDSEYIKSKELPFLIEQAERKELALGILFLTKTPDKPLTVAVDIDGEPREIRLDQTYHCFTTNEKALDKLDDPQKSDVVAEIANWADRKISPQPAPGDRAIEDPALAVRLRRLGSHWDRVFVLPDRQRPKPPPTETSTTPLRTRNASGEGLFSALFGIDRDYQGDLFRAAFGAGRPVNPTFGGLRIHLLLEADSAGDGLAMAPSRKTRRYTFADLRAVQIAGPILLHLCNRGEPCADAARHMRECLDHLALGCHRFDGEAKSAAYRKARDSAALAAMDLWLLASRGEDELQRAIEEDLMPAFAGLLRRSERRSRRA